MSWKIGFQLLANASCKRCIKNNSVFKYNSKRTFSSNTVNNVRSLLEDDSIFEPVFPKEELVAHMLKNSDASIDYGSIYDKFPNAHDVIVGKKYGKPRIVWEEQDCSSSFPETPEQAKLDVRNFIEQRDMWERRKIMDIPKFCVGSIVAVTRADYFSEEGFSRFIGLCVHINRYSNTKGHLFVLRNVIMGEPLEIQYPFYHPQIQKIEVLRHERWENEMLDVGLRFLRDYPVEYSYVDEKMEAEKYTEEPSIRKWTEEDEAKYQQYLHDVFESRRGPAPE